MGILRCSWASCAACRSPGRSTLWPQWLLVVGLTLLAYLAIEVYQYRREPAEALRKDEADYVPMRLTGAVQPAPLRAGDRDGRSSPGHWAELGEAMHFPFVREVILVALTILSVKLGPADPGGQPLPLGADRRGGRALRGHLRHHDPGLALLQAKGDTIGSQPALGVLLGERRTVGLPRQRAHLPGLHLRRAGPVGRMRPIGGLTASQIVPGLGFAPAHFLAAISCGAAHDGSHAPT